MHRNKSENKSMIIAALFYVFFLSNQMINLIWKQTIIAIYNIGVVICISIDDRINAYIIHWFALGGLSSQAKNQNDTLSNGIQTTNFQLPKPSAPSKKKRKTGNHSPQIKWLILSSEVWISNPIFDCICCTVESVIKYVKLMWELTNWQRGVYQTYFTDSILSGMTTKKIK